MGETATKTPPAWMRAKTMPVRLSIFFALVALGVRLALPGSDPFILYFEQFLKTGGQGRGHAAAARIAQLGERGVSGLRAVLDNPEANDRELGAALQLIGEVGATSLASRLLSLAEAGHPTELRLAALTGIGSMGGTSSVSVLLVSLDDEHKEIRSAALRAVGSVKQEADAAKLVSRVVKLAAEGTATERPEALAALGRIGTAAARAALWERYNDAVPAEDAIAARRALAGFGPPDARARKELIEIAGGYLPVAWQAPTPRARERLETALRTMLALRIEDILLAEHESTESCEDEEACAERDKYYRDLIRRRSTLEISGDTFLPLRTDGAKAETLTLLRSRWLVGGSKTRSVRHQSLSLVRMIGTQPAIFPIRESGYDPAAGAEEENGLPDLGQVVRINGELSANSLVVTLAVPTMGVLDEERYRFEGGVFVPVRSGER